MEVRPRAASTTMEHPLCVWRAGVPRTAWGVHRPAGAMTLPQGSDASLPNGAARQSRSSVSRAAFNREASESEPPRSGGMGGRISAVGGTDVRFRPRPPPGRAPRGASARVIGPEAGGRGGWACAASSRQDGVGAVERGFDRGSPSGRARRVRSSGPAGAAGRGPKSCPANCPAPYLAPTPLSWSRPISRPLRSRHRSRRPGSATPPRQKVRAARAPLDEPPGRRPEQHQGDDNAGAAPRPAGRRAAPRRAGRRPRRRRPSPGWASRRRRARAAPAPGAARSGRRGCRPWLRPSAAPATARRWRAPRPSPAAPAPAARPRHRPRRRAAGRAAFPALAASKGAQAPPDSFVTWREGTLG